VAGALDLSTNVRRQNEEDAGALSFEHIDGADLDQLRLRIAAALAR